MPGYGLAVILEPHPVGQTFRADALPLHVTIIDSFEINKDVDSLHALLKQALMKHKAIRVKAVADDAYGPAKDIPVTVLEPVPELLSLHQTVVDCIANNGGVLRHPEFNGAHFSPHVSVYGPRRIDVGDVVEIADISIAGKVPDDPYDSRQILATVELVQ